MNIQNLFTSSFNFSMKDTAAPTHAQLFILGHKSASQRANEFKKIVSGYALDHNREKILKSDKKLLHFVGKEHVLWLLQGYDAKSTTSSWPRESAYVYYRDHGASVAQQLKAHHVDELNVTLYDVGADELKAFVVGMELAQYNFLTAFKGGDSNEIKINFINLKSGKKTKVESSVVQRAACEAYGVQLARHLVNLPPNEMNPETIEQMVKKDLGFNKASVKIEIWDQKKLVAENMNLLLAVGRGSETPPRMIRIRYRPVKKSKKAPIAFVGKGITFDTGGLDLKPSSAMRLMKKDMGGAAAVLGLAYWAIHSAYERPCDFYLALAENSVDGSAMRPSDVYKSRAGYLVEIDNTDAEGRLVLADVMDVAAKQSGVEAPEFLIDLATLTGAIKVALGADVAGLFSNDDKLAQSLQSSGATTGEPNWRMPLVQKYFSSLSSNFADFKNSGEGFGGAITAALFLEKFCNGKKWAHLDIYSWTDRAQGPFAAAGGNGQPVQSMIHFLRTQV